MNNYDFDYLWSILLSFSLDMIDLIKEMINVYFYFSYFWIVSIFLNGEILLTCFMLDANIERSILKSRIKNKYYYSELFLNFFWNLNNYFPFIYRI